MSVLKKPLSIMKKRKRTEKSKYKHQTTGDYCTCAAYVAEIMCIRNAEYKNVGHLSYKFWSKKPWDWTFKRQMFAANKIIESYGEEALVKAVHSSDLKSVFSLNHKKVLQVVSRYAIILKEQLNKKQNIEHSENASKRKKNFGRRSKLDKLRRLEQDGQEEA
mgnify:FL=1